MKQSKYVILLCLSLLLGFSSCEMKDELLGNDETTEQAGTLDVELFSIYNNVIMSRADIATDNETVDGVFNEEDTDVNNYTLIVTNRDTNEEVVNELVSELKDEEGKISLPMSAGNYSVRAFNYDNSNATVSTRPYFEGSANFSIKEGTVTNVDLSCKLACIEIRLRLTQAFEDAFRDDFSVTVDNGDGTSQVFTKDNLGIRYYFKTPVNKNSLNVSVKATSVEGNEIQMSYSVQKPDAEGGLANLAGGDSFIINLTEQGATDAYVEEIGIEVDLTFTEDGSTIEIPVENIIYNGPNLPGGGSTPPTPPVGEGITFTGLPATYSAANGSQTIAGLQDVVIKVSPESTGIKNLNVTISGAITNLLGMVSLPATFDICNLDDGVKTALVGLQLISEEDYTNLHAGTLKEFTFKLGGLLVLVPQVTAAGTQSVFNLAVNDGVTTADGDITVNVN